MSLISMYLLAVVGSSLTRIVWFLTEHSWKDVSQELRLSWQKYLWQDLTAGLWLVGQFLSDNNVLEAQQQALGNRLSEIAEYQKGVSYWRLSEVEQHAIQEIAKQELEGQLFNFDRVMRSLEASRRATRRFAWATTLVALLSAPIKLLTAPVAADGENTIKFESVSGPIGKSNSFAFVWWQLPGMSMEDAKFFFNSSNGFTPFVMIRDTGGDSRLGGGVCWGQSLCQKKVSAGCMFRAFTNGTRGSPALAQIYPTLDVRVMRGATIGGFAFGSQSLSGGKMRWTYGPTTYVKLGKSDTFYAEVDYPGPLTFQIGVYHSLRW